MVTKGTGLPFVDDGACFIDDIETLGPACVDLVYRILYGIDNKRNPVVETPHEIPCDRETLIRCPRLRIANRFRFVRVHLPFIFGMSFLYIYRHEICAVSIALVQTLHALN